MTTLDLYQNSLTPEQIDSKISDFDYPIVKKSQDIYKMIDSNPQSILIGHTGSGKSTITPLLLLKHKIENGVSGKIVVTQPRQLATRTVADRVSSILGVKNGEEVGYRHRGESKTSSKTSVEFQTDGLLLSEIRSDPLLKKYSYVMVDEAHERSLNIDLLLGLLKRANILRAQEGLPLLRIVIASATIDKEKFKQYFSNLDNETSANNLEVEGRLYPVEKYYEENPVNDYTTRAVEILEKSIANGDTGNVLIFMPGKDFVNETITKLNSFLAVSGRHSDFVVLPLHAEVPSDEQKKVFAPNTKRKIIVATNIAETSVTIDGIGVVIDSGLIKQSDFDSTTGAKSLNLVRHSQSGLNQRAGRAGRTRSGVCYRLFTESDFDSRLEHTQPEIKRSDISSFILIMKSIGISNVLPFTSENQSGFDYIDPPKITSITDSLKLLKNLGLVDEYENITEIGREVAGLPLEPRLGKMVVEANRFGCVPEAVTIASFLSNTKPILRSNIDYNQSSKRKTLVGENIFETYLNIFYEYNKIPHSGRYTWCFERGINYKDLEEVLKNRKSLVSIIDVPQHHQKITKDKLQDVYAAICSAHTDFISYCYKDGTYSLSNPVNVSSIFPDKNGQIPNDTFLYIGLNQTTDRRGRPIAFLNNVLNLSPEILKKVAPHILNDVSTYSIGFNSVMLKVSEIFVKIGNEQHRISSTTEEIVSPSGEIIEHFIRNRKSTETVNAFNSIKNKINKIISLNPKVKNLIPQDALDYETLLSGFCLSISEVEGVVQKLSGSSFSGIGFVEKEFLNYILKTVPNLAEILEQHEKSIEPREIFVSEKSTGVTFVPEVFEGVLVYKLKGELLEICRFYSDLIKESSGIPLLYNGKPVLESIKTFLSSEFDNGYYVTYNNNLNFIQRYNPSQEDLKQINEIPEDSLEYLEINTGITNPLNKKKITVYAFKIPAYASSPPSNKGVVKNGVFLTTSLEEVQIVQGKLTQAIEAARILQKNKLEVQSLIEEIGENKVNLFIDKHRNVPGFNAEIEQEIRKISKDITNSLLYILNYNGNLTEENRAIVQKFKDYMLFVEENSNKNSQELQDYYIEEVEKLIKERMSVCPVHRTPLNDKNDFCCTKNHKNELVGDSFSSRSLINSLSSNRVVSLIYLGAGTENPFVVGGQYYEDSNSNSSKRRGDDFYSLNSFFYDGVYDQDEGIVVNSFEYFKLNFTNSKNQSFRYRKLDLNNLDEINVFLGPVSYFSRYSKN